MKCDDCLNVLEEYVDGETPQRVAEQVSAHIISCAACGQAFDALTAEQEFYGRYDRELTVPASMWGVIAAQATSQWAASSTSLAKRRWVWWPDLFSTRSFGVAGALATLLIAFSIGLAYLLSQRQTPVSRDSTAQYQILPNSTSNHANTSGTEQTEASNLAAAKPPLVASVKTVKARGTKPKNAAAGQGDVLFVDTSEADLDERDTTSHLEQAQNLLLSFRNIKVSDDDEEVDVSYEKSESRRLLNENIILRRDAEMTGKFPAKSVLGSLEPFLIDIANLPEKATPADVRQIRDRMQKTEIVAELRSY